MTDMRKDEKKKLVVLADALFNDIFSATDEEILRDFCETGGDCAAIGDQMREKFEDTKIQARKERMKAAKAGRKAARASYAPADVVDISTARRALSKALKQEGLSMAARNETESDLTDEEVVRKYGDLVRLGVIDLDKDRS